MLAALAWRERRRYGPRAPGQQRLALIAGVFFAADLIFWHEAIDDVGAGLATVLGNLQVVIVPFAAWAVLHEPPGRRILAALPLVLLGIVLISGVLEADAYGDDPARGVLFGVLTGIAYAGFLLVLRHGNEDLRRPAGPLCDATAVAAARLARRRRSCSAWTTSRRLALGRLAGHARALARRCSAGC